MAQRRPLSEPLDPNNPDPFGGGFPLPEGDVTGDVGGTDLLNNRGFNGPGDNSGSVSGFGGPPPTGGVTPLGGTPPVAGDPPPPPPTDPGSGMNIHAILESILKGGVGNINEEALNARLGSARTHLGAKRRGDLAQTQATLADRGLVGSGPELAALANEDQNIAAEYGANFSDIFGNESDNADKRFMNALGLATGLTQSDIQAAIDQFVATNNFTLGQGQLTLAQELGQGNLQNDSINQLIALIQSLQNGSSIGAQGSN